MDIFFGITDHQWVSILFGFVHFLSFYWAKNMLAMTKIFFLGGMICGSDLELPQFCYLGGHKSCPVAKQLSKNGKWNEVHISDY